MVQRLCGICPVSHHLAAASRGMDVIVSNRLTAVPGSCAGLMHYGQICSHAWCVRPTCSSVSIAGHSAQYRRRRRPIRSPGARC